MTTLRARLIRLRPNLLPLLREAAKPPGFTRRLQDFTKEQEEKALRLIRDGKSEFEVLAFLGGGGLGEVRVNHPAVYRELMSKRKRP